MPKVHPDRVVFIYGLVDPADPEHVRYVGQSVDPKHRWRSHKQEAVHGPWGRVSQHTHRALWIAKVIREGRTPQVVILEETLEVQWAIREKDWIARLRAEGHDLTNGTEGGEGVPCLSEATRARIAAGVSRAHRGRSFTEGHRRRIAEALTGRRATAAARLKMSQAVRSGGSWRRTLIAPDGTEHEVRCVAAFCRANGLKPSGLYDVLRGKCSHHRGWRIRRAPAE